LLFHQRYKMKILKVLLTILIPLMASQCAESSTPTNQEASTALTSVQERLVESDVQFGFKLFKEIIKKEKDKNVFISPLSVSMALGMTYNGADGKTKEDMQKTLELNGLSTQEMNQCYKQLIESLIQLDPKVEFEIANSIWHREDLNFEESFIDLNKTYFNALVNGLDFKNPDAVKRINMWVDENTNGKIKNIVTPPIDPQTVMFLINAIYFKGTWTYEFNENLTTDDQFILPDGTKKDCKMMEQKRDFQYFQDPDFQAVDLPYGDGHFSLTILLPRPQKNIDSLILEFNQKNWDRWMDSFRRQKGHLQFPKFKLEYELELNEVLDTLGMGIAFYPNKADFTKMYKGKDSLFISKVKHKTFVKVNEEGTEAAAVTSVGMALTTSVEPPGFVMRVDRPFVFVIREKQSQTILFVGKITEPDYK
jgi:serine protease inhibitor